MGLKPIANGAVMPAGTAKAATLDEDKLTLSIDEVQTEQSFGDPVQTAPLDFPIARVIYPDGFVKHHEAADLPTLIARIQGTLSGRYGVAGFSIASTPGDLKPGKIELTGVTYGQ